MCEQLLAVGAVVIIFLGAGAIIWKVMDGGFGPFNTSVLILTLVLFVAGIAIALDRLDNQIIGNILFAVVGFAGGLVAKKGERERPASSNG